MPRIRLGEVRSTFDAARSWAEVNPDAPAVMIASRQTAGRGRLGRSWESPEGGCWLTLVWPLGSIAVASLAGLLAADASAGVIEGVIGSDEPPVPVKIRWPNDLLIGGAKVGGLLGETVAGPAGAGGGVTLLLGIGINVNNTIGRGAEPLRTPAVSVAEASGQAVDLERLTDDLIGAVVGALGGLQADGLTGAQRARVDARLAYRGAPVRLSGSGDDTEGVLRGIDGTGRVLIETDAGVAAFATGELSCRPLDG